MPTETGHPALASSVADPVLSQQLQTRWSELRALLDRACLEAGRAADEVVLLPVSKTFPAPVVAAAAALGWSRFGENRMQEIRDKQQALANGPPLTWVLIGHLQSNKANYAARLVSELQSLDRIELAERLDRCLQQEGRRMTALIQVKTARESSKHGIAPEALPAFYHGLRACSSIEVQGLMTVATQTEERREVRRCFAQLRECRERLQQLAGVALPRLSMGMSTDYPLAIAEGATEVRIGTALFGVRTSERL